MEIKGPGRITSPSVKRKKGKAGTDKAAFKKALSAEEAAPASHLSGTTPLAAVDSLLSLQELPTSTEGRSRGLAHAEDMLQHLEQIQQGLLLGHMPKHRLQDIVRAISREQGKSHDPKLDSILKDIELRVKVELAKLDMLG